MATPNPRLQEIFGRHDAEARVKLNQRQRDALEILGCALIIDALIDTHDEADSRSAALGFISFRGHDYTIEPEHARAWSGHLAKLAINCGFEDGLHGAVIVADAIEYEHKPAEG